MFSLVKVEDRYWNFFDDIYDFCVRVVKELESDKRNVEQTINNMQYKDWENNSSCLLYRTYVKYDYDNDKGMLYLLYQGDEVVAVSAIVRYDENVAVLCKRTYLMNKIKGKAFTHEYFIEPQIDWARNKGFKAGIFLMNEYMKPLYLMLKRASEGKGFQLGVPIYDRCKDFICLGGPYEMYSTPQYVIMFKIGKFSDGDVERWKNNLKLIV